MYSEEETELRDLILQSLENSGFLSKLKAELRAGVFLALEENGNLKNKIPLFNKEFDEFSATSNGKLMLSIIRDFLEYFNLKFTLSVFEPEIAAKSACMSRTEICELLKVNSDIRKPIISELLKEKFSNMGHSSTMENMQTEDKKVINPINESTSNSDVEAFAESNEDKKGKILIDSGKEITKCEENSAKENTDVPDALSKSGVFLKSLKEKNVVESPESKIDKEKNVTKEMNDAFSSDHDPFFDEPLPSEKASFFSFSETFKEKPISKPPEMAKDDLSKSSLASLKGLPSLTDNEWSFSRDPKNAFPSLESQKSVSSSETSNEEVINLDPKENFQKKDAESNEESSEKPNSEESIEEEIEEDFSAGFDDLLNSSLSLADDATTDQTVSQTSVVEGVDHVEPCK